MVLKSNLSNTENEEEWKKKPLISPLEQTFGFIRELACNSEAAHRPYLGKKGNTENPLVPNDPNLIFLKQLINNCLAKFQLDA